MFLFGLIINNLKPKYSPKVQLSPKVQYSLKIQWSPKVQFSQKVQSFPFHIFQGFAEVHQ